MLVECVEFRAVNSEFLKGVGKIRLIEWGMLISDIKLMKSKEGKYWCAWPDRQYQTAQGEKKFYKIIHFEDKEKGRQIMKDAEEALLSKWKANHEERDSHKRDLDFNFDHL